MTTWSALRQAQGPPAPTKTAGLCGGRLIVCEEGLFLRVEFQCEVETRDEGLQGAAGEVGFGGVAAGDELEVQALALQEVRDELKNGMGTQFDKEYAGIMLRLMDERAGEYE